MKSRSNGCDLPPIAIDTREKKPYRFRKYGCSTTTETLKTCDYSLVGCTHLVGVERKSVQDLFNSLCAGRARFEREVLRMKEMDCTLLVVESTLDRILRHPPKYAKLPGRTVMRSLLSWRVKHGLNVMFVGSRKLGEATTYRFLDTWWRHRAPKALEERPAS